MKANLCLTLLCGAALMGAFLTSSQAEAQCVMSFNGRVHTTFEAELADDVGYPDRNLEGAEIRVQGAQRYGSWTTYGTDRTDRIGRFFVSQRFNRRSPCNNGRYIRVQVRFENDDLKVRPVQWHTIFDSREGSGRRTYRLASNNLGSIDIDGRGQTNALAQQHANLWAVYKRVLDYFEDLGPELAFNDQVSVKYPHNSILVPDELEDSYTYPGSGQVYLFRGFGQDDFEMRTMIHELMHIWAYQHDSGPTGLAPNLIISGNTHQQIEPTHVAFHEGWAEYAMQEVRAAIFVPQSNRTEPFHRNFFNDEEDFDRVNTLDDMEHNEDGWITLFSTLSTSAVYQYAYGTYEDAPGGARNSRVNDDAFLTGTARDVMCEQVEPWTLSFEDVLQVWVDSPGDGLFNNITRQEMTFDRFLRRVELIHSLDEDQIQTILDIIDLEQTAEPKDLMDCAYEPFIFPWSPPIRK